MSEIVMYDSPEAASPTTATVTGWVSRLGRFYSDEGTARYDGATHWKCQDCEAAVKIPARRCEACQAVCAVRSYAEMPRKAWDGKAMLYSEYLDEFFADFSRIEDCVDDLLEEEKVEIDKLRLVICEPIYMRQIDEEDIMQDGPEEAEMDDDIWTALEALNKLIREAEPIGWIPGKYAIDLEASHVK